MTPSDSELDPYLRRLRKVTMRADLTREERIEAGAKLLREAITGKPADA